MNIQASVTSSINIFSGILIVYLISPLCSLNIWNLYKLQYFSKLGLGQYQIKIKVGLLFFNSPKPTRVGYIKHIELTLDRLRRIQSS